MNVGEEEEEEGEQGTEIEGYVMQIGSDGKLPSTWILLDNQSTVDVFSNKNLITDIRETSSTMNIHCNAGITSTNMVGELRGYGTVWYNPYGIANILSLARVQELGYRVTYDTSDGHAFHLHKNDGTVRVFKQSKKGLYYLDTSENTKDVTLVNEHAEMTNEASDVDTHIKDTNGVGLVNTVADNATKYSERDYSQAVLARKIQKIIGRPSTKTFLSIVEKNLLPNCPVTRDDIIAAGPKIRSARSEERRVGKEC